MAAPGLTQAQEEQLQSMGSIFGGDQMREQMRQQMLAQNESSYLQKTVSNTPGNNPWLLDAQKLSKDSSYNPDNYFVSGNGIAGGQGVINSPDAQGGNTAEIIQGPGTNLAGSQGQGTGKGLGVPGGLNNQDTNASTYPTMQNAFGLGTNGAPSPAGGTPVDSIQPSMQAPIPGNNSDPNYAVNALSKAVGDSGSRGFNPWSMQGEANARSGK